MFKKIVVTVGVSILLYLGEVIVIMSLQNLLCKEGSCKSSDNILPYVLYALSLVINPLLLSGFSKQIKTLDYDWRLRTFVAIFPAIAISFLALMQFAG